ncbi:MAG: hypothetical protein CMI34_05600 [Opitutales bacterium]|nr:hypothetical protein [Opitutales bacterium]
MRLKISHISTSDSEGGSANSARRIHNNLLKNGISSNIFVGNKNLNDKNSSYLSKHKQLRKIDNILDRVTNKIGFQYQFLPSNLFLNETLKNSDIIQLYNLHGGYFQFSTLSKLSKISPLIWRFSDYWPLTGHCAYPKECQKWENGCYSCPDLKLYPSIGFDRTRALWREKQKIIKDTNIIVVVPTKKMSDEVKKSKIFSGKEIRQIPNGINTSLFKPFKKIEARKKLKIKNIFTILFIAHVAYDNPRKGTDYIYKISNLIKDKNDIQLLIVGLNSKKWKKLDNENIVTIDLVSDSKIKNIIYNAADCLILPSEQENFPNVMLESMSCGTPVIAFNSGDFSDIIKPNNGILIDKPNSEKLKKKILFLKNSEILNNEFGRNARKIIVKKYSSEIELMKYLNLYNELLDHKSFIDKI